MYVVCMLLPLPDELLLLFALFLELNACFKISIVKGISASFDYICQRFTRTMRETSNCLL